MKKLITLLLLLPLGMQAQYTGTGSVTQGVGNTTISNLYICQGGRTAAMGNITATDNSVWQLPAQVNYINSNFPAASDLNNPCNGNNYLTTDSALAALSGTDIVTVNTDGEVFTAFIFADNYFEMYVNGVAVGKDNVPFTQFNSNIVRFKANKPFTIAMLIVDWEEKLGLGCEENGGFAYHPGDGGVVVVVKDALGDIVAISGNDWKAQTFYSAPIMDLTCPTETGSLRSTVNCSTADSQDGSLYYGLHWPRPTNWSTDTFDDSAWPSASTYSNTTVGVGNKPAYTNFTDIFDAPGNDAEFIWSSNLILDNEVIVRHKVTGPISAPDPSLGTQSIRLFPNPAQGSVQITYGKNSVSAAVQSVVVYDMQGRQCLEAQAAVSELDIHALHSGLYLVRINFASKSETLKLVVE